MKSFLISIHPKWVAKIFNGDKTIEIRRTAPKDWKDYLSGKTKKKPEPMKGYIYCPKSSCERLHKNKNGWFVNEMSTIFLDGVATEQEYNGKVVAKFRLREVEEINYDHDDHEEWYDTHSMNELILYERSGLDYEQIDDYMNGKLGYAWHISDLQIFDKPKELSDFMKPNWDDGLDEALEQARKEDAKIAERIHNECSFDGEIDNCEELTLAGFKLSGRITKAPQSWCYAEVLATDFVAWRKNHEEK